MHFVLPEKVAGFKNGGIGPQGPAISTDSGDTWAWMGTQNVQENAFFYDFTRADETIRLAVTIPYLQTDLARFLKANATNEQLQVTQLTHSRKGREVELLQIGTPGENIHPVLVTARHHAVETMASFVLEGFLQEAMSDSAAGESFRQRYVLFAVPLVDKDGVEDGNQGKNRQPHDHNRDYGEVSIYPEVRAIKALDEVQDFKFALDFHCPTLVLPDHQVMYFVGARAHPRYNFENVSLFAQNIQQGLPQTAPRGPLVWLRDEADPAPMNSRYFGFKEGAIMAATLEFPSAPPGRLTDPASCRLYGAVILRAFVETHFQASDFQWTVR